MGRGQANQPLLDEEGVSSSSYSGFQSCQHAVRPDTAVRPRPYRRGFSGRCSRERHYGRFCVRGFGHSTSTFLRPFAPRELPRFNATMDALTPAWRLFVPHVAAMNTVLFHAGLPVSRVGTSDHSVSNHPLLPLGRCLLFSPRLTAREQPAGRYAPVPVGRSVIWASPLPSRLAAATGRIEFVILRTGRSPPVALHLVSRRRSYFRLQGSDKPWQGLAPCCPYRHAIQAH